VSAGLAYSLYRLHVRPSLCRTSASEGAICDLRRHTSVMCLCLLHVLDHFVIRAGLDRLALTRWAGWFGVQVGRYVKC